MPAVFLIPGIPRDEKEPRWSDQTIGALYRQKNLLFLFSPFPSWKLIPGMYDEKTARSHRRAARRIPEENLPFQPFHSAESTAGLPLFISPRLSLNIPEAVQEYTPSAAFLQKFY